LECPSATNLSISFSRAVKDSIKEEGAASDGPAGRRGWRQRRVSLPPFPGCLRFHYPREQPHGDLLVQGGFARQRPAYSALYLP
jgi:hypothetical protein